MDGKIKDAERKEIKQQAATTTADNIFRECINLNPKKIVGAGIEEKKI